MCVCVCVCGMFFKRVLEQLIELSPKFLGQGLLTHLHSELVKKVEGSCAGSLGYIVCVIEIKERGEVWMEPAHTHRDDDARDDEAISSSGE